MLFFSTAHQSSWLSYLSRDCLEATNLATVARLQNLGCQGRRKEAQEVVVFNRIIL